MPRHPAKPDPTPTFVHIGFYVIQSILNALIRISIINPGLYIGVRMPAAGSPAVLRGFVRAWNEAMSWACPTLALAAISLLFGFYAFRVYAKLAGGARRTADYRGVFCIGVAGFLMPSLASLGMAWLTRGNLAMALAPVGFNFLVFWLYSRRTMWDQFLRLRARAGRVSGA